MLEQHQFNSAQLIKKNTMKSAFTDLIFKVRLKMLAKTLANSLNSRMAKNLNDN